MLISMWWRFPGSLIDCFAGWFAERLIEWSIQWLSEWFVEWLTALLILSLIEWRFAWFTGRLIQWFIEWLTELTTLIQIDWMPHWFIDLIVARLLKCLITQCIYRCPHYYRMADWFVDIMVRRVVITVSTISSYQKRNSRNNARVLPYRVSYLVAVQHASAARHTAFIAAMQRHTADNQCYANDDRTYARHPVGTLSLVCSTKKRCSGNR